MPCNTTIGGRPYIPGIRLGRRYGADTGRAGCIGTHVTRDIVAGWAHRIHIAAPRAVEHLEICRYLQAHAEWRLRKWRSDRRCIVLSALPADRIAWPRGGWTIRRSPIIAGSRKLNDGRRRVQGKTHRQ